MTTNAFRHRPPEQCTLSKEDQQHILRISNNDQDSSMNRWLSFGIFVPCRQEVARSDTPVDVTDARDRRGLTVLNVAISRRLEADERADRPAMAEQVSV